ncbi:MAG: CDP-alcohol phosphatidyltransferase family protein [Caldilineaceae bacterium]|nr:CDP-alcohol phosphatidyltransferase family protein [Caldilineaceae bacterium]
MTLSHQQPHLETEAMNRLRRRWGAVALLYSLVWWLTYQLLQSTMHATFADRWRLFSAALALLLLGFLWRGLRYNRRTEASHLWPTLGYGNWLSLLRGIVLCLLAGFFLLPRPTVALTWLPALLYTADRVTDLFDGYLARRTGRVSKLGAMLDIELDGLGLLIAVVLGVQYGLLPVWYLLLAVSRQLFVMGLWLRRRAGLPNRDLPPSDNRRVIAGFQTGFLCVVFWPLLTPAVTQWAAVLFAIPLIYSFGRDWLVVSYVIDPESALYRKTRSVIKLCFERYLPVLARGMCVGLMVWFLWPFGDAATPWSATVHRWQLPYVSLWSGLLWGIFAVATVATLLGIAGRLAALCLLGFVLLLIGGQGIITPGSGLLLSSTITVAHLGAGNWSLWQPEEIWLHTQYG